MSPRVFAAVMIGAGGYIPSSGLHGVSCCVHRVGASSGRELFLTDVYVCRVQGLADGGAARATSRRDGVGMERLVESEFSPGSAAELCYMGLSRREVRAGVALKDSDCWDSGVRGV